MVSVTVLVVSVVEVIEPCVKLGTTGTAIAVDALARAITPTVIARYSFISYHKSYLIVSSVTCCPVATVPAPPAVSVIAPALVIVPASVSFAPAAVDV